MDERLAPRQSEKRGAEGKEEKKGFVMFRAPILTESAGKQDLLRAQSALVSKTAG